MKNVLIIGAGEAGKLACSLIKENHKLNATYNIIGFLDDNLTGNKVLNLPVLGKISEASSVILQHKIDEVLIAIPSASNEVITRIFKNILPLKVSVKIVPGFYEIVEGSFDLRQIRKINIQDLLGREEVGFDVDKIAPFYEGKKIFITGAGGSIGSEILNQLSDLPVSEIIAFGHGENSIHSLILKFSNDPRFKYVIGDIRDTSKLRHEISKFKPDIIFHTAAHKHVNLMENYPDEAVKNNIIGTFNVADISSKYGVKDFILISTDKAVNPTSLMGATKRMAEKIVLSMNSFTDTSFKIVRFGNVLGSRGSVVPIFLQQIENGKPLTVTHPEATRYFMSIREASRLVIKSATVDNGNIFILDMGKPIKILELARNILYMHGYNEEEIPIVFTGLKKGEKLHEELMFKKENLSASRFEKLYISNEKECFFTRNQIARIIKEFKKISETYNKEKIIKTLKKYLPEFSPGEIYE